MIPIDIIYQRYKAISYATLCNLASTVDNKITKLLAIDLLDTATVFGAQSLWGLEPLGPRAFGAQSLGAMNLGAMNL